MDEINESSVQPTADSLSEASDSVPPPEDFAPSPRKIPGPFQRWPQKSETVLPIIFSLFCAAISLYYWNYEVDFLATSGESVYRNGEFFSLLTALFVHGDLSHLGLNLMPLLFFGWMLKAYFGPFAFPVVPLALGVASNAITIAFYPPHTRLLGASGMIFGMIAIWLVLYIRFDRDNRFVFKMARVIGFILMLLLPHTYEPDVSYLAHASGFILGTISGIIMLPWVTLREPPPVEPPPPSRRYYRIVRARRRI